MEPPPWFPEFISSKLVVWLNKDMRRGKPMVRGYRFGLSPDRLDHGLDGEKTDYMGPISTLQRMWETSSRYRGLLRGHGGGRTGRPGALSGASVSYCYSSECLDWPQARCRLLIL